MSVFHDGKWKPFHPRALERTRGERLLLACAFALPWLIALPALIWAIGDILGLW
jgi:hypothetical protein